MVVWWYDFLEHKIYTLCTVRTACFYVYAIERLYLHKHSPQYELSWDLGGLVKNSPQYEWSWDLGGLVKNVEAIYLHKNSPQYEWS